MGKILPKLFVGSSSEAREIAQAFCQALGDDTRPVPWWLAPEFEVTYSVLGGLRGAAEMYDFGLFILTPDDEIESRGERSKSARDNVIFELGLFLGTLGPERTFLVIRESQDKDQRVKVPSDLNGVIIPRFTFYDEHDLLSSVNLAVQKFIRRIKKEDRRQNKFKLVKGWSYDNNEKTLSVTLSAVKIERRIASIQDKKVTIIGRVRNEDSNFEEDTNFGLMTPRKIPRYRGHQDLILRIQEAERFAEVNEDDVIEWMLLLIPRNVDVEKKKNILEMVDAGCDILFHGGIKVRP